jgi:hypothetical protein
MFRELVIYFTVSVAMTAMAAVPALAQTITFGGVPIGELPSDFVSALTGRGPEARWQVTADNDAIDRRVLAQLNPDPTDRFPLAIHQRIELRDVEVTIHFKPVAGKVDQAGGVAIRLADRNNYYVARANALEDNVRFYRVARGRREQIAGVKVQVASGAWHTLSLRAQGENFTVGYDGKTLFTASDKTFLSSGKIALWTKADSVTHFDRIEITPLQ